MNASACLSDAVKQVPQADRERRLAITAELLYLANLTVLPVIALIVLAMLWRKQDERSSLAANHIEQALFTPLWAALLMLAMTAAVLLTGETTALSWSILLPALALLHGGLILLGGVGLTRAMAGCRWRYPILGPEIEEPEKTLLTQGADRRQASWKR